MSDIPDVGIPVQLPSGATFPVLTPDEATYVEERVRRYMSENRFVNISDHQDIDRMVMFELFVHRWSLWLSRGVDYYNDPINERQIAERVAAYSSEVRQLKKSLGVDKVARDRQRGDDSVHAYFEQLRARAGEFAVMRNDQHAKVIELFHQLKALVTYHQNSDDTEQLEGHIQQADLIEWVTEVAIPEFEAIDQTFRDTKQKYWVRKQ